MSTPIQNNASRLASDTHMGQVVLDVRDLNLMKNFYHEVIGLDILVDSNIAVLGRSGETGLLDVPLVELREDKSLPIRPEGSAGLYHTAILFESAEHLAAAVVRIARQASHLYTGSGDHHVSQAFYLDDPEGNGIELYIDRPRDQWTWTNGQVYMTTEYIDPNQFIAEHASEFTGKTSTKRDKSVLGHVHLQVGDIPTARTFYVDTLGFDMTATLRNSALFVSAGGYHHHMAMNTWNSAGAGPRTPSLGLGRATIVVPTRAEVERILAVTGGHDDGQNVVVKDPWNNELTFVSAA